MDRRTPQQIVEDDKAFIDALRELPDRPARDQKGSPMPDNEKVLIAEAREYVKTWPIRAAAAGYIGALADALEARVHPTVTDAEVQAAVERIKARLTWPSLHWGVEDLHSDALPHIARAALEAARAVQPTTNPKETP